LLFVICARIILPAETVLVMINPEIMLIMDIAIAISSKIDPFRRRALPNSE
jgi:hypothetical protein